MRKPFIFRPKSGTRPELLDFISSRFHSPTLCGLLLAGPPRPRKGSQLSFDPACRMAMLPCRSRADFDYPATCWITPLKRRSAPLPHEPVEVLIPVECARLIVLMSPIRGSELRRRCASGSFERGITTKTAATTASALSDRKLCRRAGGTIEVADNTLTRHIFHCLFPPREAGVPSGTGTGTGKETDYAT